PDADRATRQARRTANSIVALLTFDMALRLLGLLLLVLFGIAGLVRLAIRASEQRPAAVLMGERSIDGFYAPPTYTQTPASARPLPRPAATAASPFSYRARMIAFV